MLSDIVEGHRVSSVKKDLVWQVGDSSDGAIEFVALTENGKFEVGYHYGDTKPKNLIIISTQVGCQSQCNFCPMGDEPFVRDILPDEMYDQVILMLQQAVSYGMDIDSVKHKVNLTKGGEPLFNRHIVEGIEKIAELAFSFKFSTVFPKGLDDRLRRVADFAADYDESIQLQISLISTSEDERDSIAGIKLASFYDIRHAADYWMNKNPDRKVNLSLILTENFSYDAARAVDVFPPELFRFRFRNYVEEDNGKSSGIVTLSELRLRQLKNNFKAHGYDVFDDATPTPIEKRFGLADGITLTRYMKIIRGEM